MFGLLWTGLTTRPNSKSVHCNERNIKLKGRRQIEEGYERSQLASSRLSYTINDAMMPSTAGTINGGLVRGQST
jgi:hypothetical protein